MSDKIDYYKCEDCPFSDMDHGEASYHEHASGHTVVPVYV